MEELTVAIEQRSSRGVARGAHEVFERARQRVAQQRRRRHVSIAAACAVVVTVVAVALVARDGSDEARVIAGPGETLAKRAQGPVLVWYDYDGGFNVAEADTNKLLFRTVQPDAGCATCRMVQIGNYVLTAASGVHRLSLDDGRVERIAAGHGIFLAGDPNSVLVVDHQQLSRIDVDGRLIGGPWTLPAEYRLTDPPRATASGVLVEWTGDALSSGRRLAEWKPDSAAAPVQLTTFTRLIDVRESGPATTTAWMIADCTSSPCDFSIVIDGLIRLRPPAGAVGFIGGGAISPDGSTLAAFAMVDERDREARLVLIDLRAGTITAPIEDSTIRYGEEYGYATWSTDGSAVYFGGADDRLRRYRPGDPAAQTLPWPSNYSMLAATAVTSAAPPTTAAPTTLPQPTPCPEPRLQPGTNEAIDFVDFVNLDGITYINQSKGPSTLPDENLGPQIATVCQSYLTRRVDGQSRDGDAAYLAEGTQIYRVKGYDQRFRVAAHRNGRIVLFEAFASPAAKVGRDLIDLSQVRTQSVAINSNVDGRTTIARIDDRQTIERLVVLLHQAPVERVTRSHNGQSYFVEFQLADGTSVNRVFFIDDGEYWSGILVPQEFTDIIRAALR